MSASKFSEHVSDRVQREAEGGTEAWAKILEWGRTPGFLNLGQGFPDFVPEATRRILKSTVAAAIDVNSCNQYSPIAGIPAIREAIAAMYSVYYDKEVDPNTQICTVASGTSGIFAAVQATVNPGEEVVIFEPFFPWYAPVVRLAGGVPRIVRLKEPHFRLERGDCEAAFNAKTKMCIINTPHNPTGRIFNEEELALVAELCLKHDTVCLSDEVYEACVYPGHRHRSISNLGGMSDRTMVIGSASKLLGITGWRVGWLIGPPALLAAASTAHSYQTFCAPTPLQHGVAAAVAEMAAHGAKQDVAGRMLDCGATSVFHENFQALSVALEKTGIQPLPSCGGYFLIADCSAAGVSGREYCQWLAEEVHFVAVPLALFYVSYDNNSLVRFCVCKKPEYMQQCIERLLTKRHPGLAHDGDD